jgi:CCR4-NOT transcription complex subunit 1
LIQETQRLARDPFLADRFRDGVDKGEGDVFRQFDLFRFVDRVGLRPLERLVISAAVISGPTRKDLVTQAANMIRTEFDDALLALSHNPSFDHADLSPAQVTKLMTNLLCDATETELLSASQVKSLISTAQNKYGKDTIAANLNRIIPHLKCVLATISLFSENH